MVVHGDNQKPPSSSSLLLLPIPSPAETKAELSCYAKPGRRIACASCDVSKFEEVQKAFRPVIADMGGFVEVGSSGSGR